MHNNAKFSVVTPNYNMARFLSETIESVLTNLQLGDEYFVIDGGSTDGSVDIIRQYEPYLTGWISEPDHGYADALVKGFQRSTGMLLCWVNSGDLLLNRALQKARTVLQETNNDLIFGDDYYIDEDNRIISRSSGYVRSLKHMMLYGGWTPLQDACYWRRSLYEKIGGINPTLKHAADYDFFLRASWAGKSCYIPEVFSAFRKHESQKSISGSLAYQKEREFCREQVMKTQNISQTKRWFDEAAFKFMVRWKHHVTRRMNRYHQTEINSFIKIGFTL